GGIAWVTQGREVENYLPQLALDSILHRPLRALTPFEVFSDYLDEMEQGAGKRFLRSKSVFAEGALRSIERESLARHLDLAQRLSAVCAEIDKWNGNPARGAA